jgi:hypothetical protein
LRPSATVEAGSNRPPGAAGCRARSGTPNIPGEIGTRSGGTRSKRDREDEIGRRDRDTHHPGPELALARSGYARAVSGCEAPRSGQVGPNHDPQEKTGARLNRVQVSGGQFRREIRGEVGLPLNSRMVESGSDGPAGADNGGAAERANGEDGCPDLSDVHAARLAAGQGAALATGHSTAARLEPERKPRHVDAGARPHATERCQRHGKVSGAS